MTARFPNIQLVIFDWAGTIVDYGCFAPVAAFLEVFQQRSVIVTPAQARVPMGLHKKDHIHALLEMPEIARQWQAVHGREWNEADVASLYDAFTPLQIEAAQRYTKLIPGVLECVAELRSRGIKIGTTTGYPRIVADPVIEAAAKQGFRSDCDVCADEVPAGRPEPFMIQRVMETLRIPDFRTVVNVGDTVPDIESGRNAGVLSLGVSETGSELGLTEVEFAAFTASEQMTQLEIVHKKLIDAGADYICRSVKELPAILDSHFRNYQMFVDRAGEEVADSLFHSRKRISGDRPNPPPTENN